MHYTIENITALIGARRFGSNATEIDWLLTDSRSLAFPEATLFFALRTKLGDGHRYIADLYRRGVRNFVVGQVPEERETAYPEANFLLVVSPLKALQRLAERHREEFELPVIPFTIALVLGDLCETNLRRSLMVSYGKWSIFFTRPICLGVLLFSLALLVYPSISRLIKKRIATKKGGQTA